jgi:2-oxo-4-hydroxy-4-carboxy-5-ureidoimidazoline decarboxylase
VQRSQLEHLIRAAAAITGADKLVVVGSQAVLGQFPDPPCELLFSMEADLFSLRSPSDADLIDGSIGEGSPFHQTFGYYAHGVAESTASLPPGWMDRLIPVRNENTRGATGLCLEVHDLAVSKLIAGREKDLQFVEVLLWNALARALVISDRFDSMALERERRDVSATRLRRLWPSLRTVENASRERFVALLGSIFEHSAWVAEATWNKRPFGNLEGLHHVLCDTVRRSAEGKQLALIRAHPDLVGKAALAGMLTPSSTAEQSSAGLNKLSAEDVAAFQSYNNAYREKFGFPFVICARLNKKEAILKAFPVRLQNSREQEIKTALEEIYKIAYFRLEAIVGPE